MKDLKRSDVNLAIGSRLNLTQKKPILKGQAPLILFLRFTYEMTNLKVRLDGQKHGSLRSFVSALALNNPGNEHDSLLDLYLGAMEDSGTDKAKAA